MFYILKTHLRFEKKPEELLSKEQFSTIVSQAIKIVLGQSGASNFLEILKFDPVRLQGDIKIEKRDLHLIWSALTIYGNHFGQRIAFSVKEIRETLEQ